MGIRFSHIALAAINAAGEAAQGELLAKNPELGAAVVLGRVAVKAIKRRRKAKKKKARAAAV
jgi:hypothetical protein